MMRSRSERADAHRPYRLTKERIVEAAIGHLHRVGPEKFSLRALAKNLGVTPMAIYRHVPNKQALMEEVRASLLELVPMVTEPAAETARAEPSLDEADIVEQALGLVREEGLSRLSMRALAKRLGVTPMAIYRHVPNKQALLMQMADVITERLPRPEPSAATWPEDFRTHARLVWKRFSEYPGLVGSFAAGPSAKVLDHLRYEQSILCASGVDEHRAGIAITAYHTFMLGLFRTHAYLDYLKRHQGGGVTLEVIRRFGDRLPLTEILEFVLDAVVTQIRVDASARSASSPERRQRKRASGRPHGNATS